MFLFDIEERIYINDILDEVVVRYNDMSSIYLNTLYHYMMHSEWSKKMWNYPDVHRVMGIHFTIYTIIHSIHRHNRCCIYDSPSSHHALTNNIAYLSNDDDDDEDGGDLLCTTDEWAYLILHDNIENWYTCIHDRMLGKDWAYLLIKKCYLNRHGAIKLYLMRKILLDRFNPVFIPYIHILGKFTSAKKSIAQYIHIRNYRIFRSGYTGILGANEQTFDRGAYVLWTGYMTCYRRLHLGHEIERLVNNMGRLDFALVVRNAGFVDAVMASKCHNYIFKYCGEYWMYI
jgi:hypothetical protein